MLSLQICHINHFSSPLLLYLSSFYFFLLTFYSTWTLNIWSSPANYPSVISEVLSQVIYLAEVTYVLPSFPIRPLSVWFPPSSLAEVTNPLTLPNTCFYKVFFIPPPLPCISPTHPPPTYAVVGGHSGFTSFAMLRWQISPPSSHFFQDLVYKMHMAQGYFLIFSTIWMEMCFIA